MLPLRPHCHLRPKPTCCRSTGSQGKRWWAFKICWKIKASHPPPLLHLFQKSGLSRNRWDFNLRNSLGSQQQNSMIVIGTTTKTMHRLQLFLIAWNLPSCAEEKTTNRLPVAEMMKIVLQLQMQISRRGRRNNRSTTYQRHSQIFPSISLPLSTLCKKPEKSRGSKCTRMLKRDKSMW